MCASIGSMVAIGWNQWVQLKTRNAWAETRNSQAETWSRWKMLSLNVLVEWYLGRKFHGLYDWRQGSQQVLTRYDKFTCTMTRILSTWGAPSRYFGPNTVEVTVLKICVHFASQWCGILGPPSKWCQYLSIIDCIAEPEQHHFDTWQASLFDLQDYLHITCDSEYSEYNDTKNVKESIRGHGHKWTMRRNHLRWNIYYIQCYFMP